jgi:hypothetical protein
LSDKLNFERDLSHDSKVLVINPLLTYWSFQLTCESALRASRISKQVRWINISHYEPKKYFINKDDFNSRITYQNSLKKINSILSEAGIDVRTNTQISRHKLKSAMEFSSLEELRGYKVAEISLGAIVYSAIASVKRSTAINLEKDSELVDHFLKSTTNMLYQLDLEISQRLPDLIISINDRLPGSALSVALAHKWNIPVKIVYWGSNPNKIIDYNNSLYDSHQWQKHIRDTWELGEHSELVRIELRREIDELALKPSKDSLTFLQAQQKGKGITKLNFTVVFYAQSEHEHSSTYLEGIEGRFKNQYEAFMALEKVCHNLGLNLVLKLHPNRFDSNSKEDSELERNEWIDKISQNTRIIPKNSDIDTYKLLNDADLNVVWNSTVGIEAIARCKPTLVLGNAHWLNLKWNIHAWNELQLLKRIEEKVWSVDPEELLPWFWYLRNFGVDCCFTSISNGLEVSGIRVIKKRILFRVFDALKSRAQSLLKSLINDSFS